MFAPSSLLGIIFIGLFVGAVASRVVQGKGHGCLADTVIGVAGSFIGGVALRAVLPGGGVIIDPFIDYVITGFIGAVLLLFVVRLVSPRNQRGRH